MSDATWRVFIGQWDEQHPHFTYVDVAGLTWAQAQARLRKSLEPFLADSCDDCREQGTEALAAVTRLQPNTEYAGQVEGDDYRITAAGYDPGAASQASP